MRLIRPLSRDAVSKARLATSHWQVAAEAEFVGAWLKELARNPAHPFERNPSCDRPFAAGLEAPAARGKQGVPPANRRGRAYRRTPACCDRRSEPPRCLQSRRRPGAFRRRRARSSAYRPGTHSAAWRPGLARFDGDERQAHRAYGLSRYRSRAAQKLRLLQRDHRLALAAVSARRIPRAGTEALSRLFLLYPPLTAALGESAEA